MMIEPISKFKTPNAWREAYGFIGVEWDMYAEYWMDYVKFKILNAFMMGLIAGYVSGKVF